MNPPRCPPRAIGLLVGVLVAAPLAPAGAADPKPASIAPSGSAGARAFDPGALHADPGDDVRPSPDGGRYVVWTTLVELGFAPTLRLDLDGAFAHGTVRIDLRGQRHPAVLEVALVDGSGRLYRAAERLLPGRGAAASWTIPPGELRDVEGRPWTPRPAAALLLVDRTGQRTADRGEQALVITGIELR